MIAGRTARAAAWVAVGLAAAARASAQEPPSVAAGFGGRWLDAHAPLEFTLSRALGPEQGRLAVLVGELDVSSVLDTTGTRWIYRPAATPLPAGESEVVVYLVTPDRRWEELARVPLRVLSRAGFEKAEVVPRVGLTNKGQVASGHEPEANRPPRGEFQDFTLNLGLQSVHVARGWQTRTQANLVAVSHRQEALRFGERGDSAARADLSDYMVTVERGRAAVNAGHVSFGNQRHLLAGFQSRGVVAALRLGRAARLELGGMNASAIVGWGNLLGLARSDHRLLGANLGLDLVPARPGLLQIDASAIQGAALPLAGFTQGVVNDAERSRGAAVRVSAALPSERLRLEAGYARSRFTNPFDAALAQGERLVSVEPVTRSARYLDLNVALLRDIGPPSLPANVALVFRHERVDPLFRTVGMPHVRADILQNVVELQAGVGPAALRLSHTRGHDNLDRIGTILGTQSRASTASLDVPGAALFGAAAPVWLPVLSFGVTRMHQYGDSVPRAGGFPDSFVPDQVSTNASIGAQAQGGAWRLALRFDRSAQDNRQIGRDSADFVNRAGTLSIGLTPLRPLDVSVDVGLETAESRERRQESATRRLATAILWRIGASTDFSGSVSTTRTTDDPRTIEQSATDVRLELSQRVRLFRARSGRAPGQLFVRYGKLSGAHAAPGVPRFAQRSWTVNTGVTLSLF